jgi:ribosome-associated protein
MTKFQYDIETEHQEEESAFSGPSKSQIKRDKLALHALAERLVALPQRELEQLNLSAATWAAIAETPRIKDQRARGRHWKRIANLLEREDMAAVHALMDDSGERERAQTAHFHALERWRERFIIEGDAALAEFVIQYPAVDRQELRSLIRAAQRDTARDKPDAPRKLFRALREMVEGGDFSPQIGASGL